MRLVVVFLLLLFVQDAPRWDKVTSTVDRSGDFGAISTYAWEKGGEAFDRGIHQALVDAVEAELAERMFQKVGLETADVTIAYYAMGSSEVDLEAFDRAGGKEIPPSKSVGTLRIAMYRQPRRVRMWMAQTRRYVDVGPEKRAATARIVVASLFETLPRKPK